MNRLVVSSLIVLVIVTLLAAGVYFYQKYSIILLDPMKAVPPDAAFIVEINKPAEAFQHFFKSSANNDLYSDSWISQVKSNYLRIDSLMKMDGDVKDIWRGEALIISTHLVNAYNYDNLFLINMPRGWTEESLKNYITKYGRLINSFAKREYESVNIYESLLNDSITFTFASYQSIAMFSFTPLLVEEAIRELKQSSSVTQTKGFKKVAIQKTKKSSVNLYMHYPSLSDFAFSLSPENKNLFFSLTYSFARWTGLEIMNDSKENVVLSGTTNTFDSTAFLSFFRNQQPQSFRVADIVPARTALMCEFGFSDFKEFYSHQKKNPWPGDESEDEKKAIIEYEKKFKTNLESYFINWTGKKMALVVTEPAGGFIDNNAYAFIHAKNVSDALIHLNTARDELSKNSGINPTEEKYRSHSISSIPIKGLIPFIYGKPFSRIVNCYYTSLNDFIVIANQSSALKVLIDEVSQGKVLVKDSLYSRSEKTMPAFSNINLYINPKRTVNMFLPVHLNSFLNTIYNASGIFVQWSYNEGSIKTQLALNFGKKKLKEPALLWSAQLDTIISCKPVLISKETIESSASETETDLFVEDEKNNLYKFDGSGNMIWKKDLQEKILSPIYPIDLYHDGRHQLLFSTKHKLHLMNQNGDNIGNFPIRLPAEASTGCTIIPSASNYNIYIACANHYIYAYDAHGKPLTEWKYIKTDYNVSKQIQAFAQDNNIASLIISEDNGSTAVYDTKGKTIVSFKDKFIQSKNGSCELLGTDSSGIMTWVTTDTSGTIIQFASDGKIFSKRTDNFSNVHSFIIDRTDITQGTTIIYSDTSRIASYDLEGNKKWSMDLVNLIPNSLTLVRSSDGLTSCGTSSRKDLFYVFNRKGEIEKGYPVNGSLNPVSLTPAFSKTGSQMHLLVCGNQNGFIYVYRIE